MSATMAILLKWKRIKITVNFLNTIGPLYKHSFTLLFSDLHLADASYTTLTFVVAYDGFITHDEVYNA